jgi:hypothetical protein
VVGQPDHEAFHPVGLDSARSRRFARRFSLLDAMVLMAAGPQGSRSIASFGPICTVGTGLYSSISEMISTLGLGWTPTG